MSFKGHVHNGTLGQALVAFWSAHVWKKNDYANMQIQKGDWGGGAKIRLHQRKGVQGGVTLVPRSTVCRPWCGLVSLVPRP